MDLEGALAEFSEAVRLKPDSATAHYNKGRSLFDLRRNEEARRELETAVRLDPRNSTALYLLAVTEKQLDNAARSADLLRQVVTLDPKNTDAHYLLGQNLAKLGKDSDAIAQWKKTTELDPEHAEALYNLARRLGQIDPAAAKPYQERFVDLQKKRRITERADTLGAKRFDLTVNYLFARLTEVPGSSLGARGNDSGSDPCVSGRGGGTFQSDPADCRAAWRWDDRNAGGADPFSRRAP